MKFEYDNKKSEANLKKHGISLEEAKHLWTAQSVTVKAKSTDEDRYMIIGNIFDKFYSCIYTRRGDVIRLISARRSRKNEEKLYYECC